MLDDNAELGAKRVPNINNIHFRKITEDDFKRTGIKMIEDDEKIPVDLDEIRSIPEKIAKLKATQKVNKTSVINNILSPNGLK